MNESVNFDRASSFYDQTRAFPPGMDTEIAAFIAQSARLQPDYHLLEVGAGTGRIAVPLAQHVSMISGVDISEQMLRTLRAKTGSERVATALGDAHQLPFRSSSFDGVIMVHVLHLVADPQRVLQEIRRVLKPDAPFLHCLSRQQHDNPVAQAWNQARPDRKRGASWERTAPLLEKYLPQPQEFTRTYTTIETPQQILEAIQKRFWSSLWDLSDEELAPGIRAIQAVVHEQLGGDFHAPLERTTDFVMQVYSL